MLKMHTCNKNVTEIKTQVLLKLLFQDKSAYKIQKWNQKIRDEMLICPENS